MLLNKIVKVESNEEYDENHIIFLEVEKPLKRPKKYNGVGCDGPNAGLSIQMHDYF